MPACWPVEGAPGQLDILNALPSPLLVLDRKGNVVLANMAAEAFFNMSQAQMQERGWEAVFPEDSPIIGLTRNSRAGRHGVAAYDLNIEFLGGRQARIDLQTGLLMDSDDWIIVTIFPRTVANLIDRQVEQQGVARSAFGMAAMLAHEIKNPLSGIRGAAQLLIDGLDREGRELTSLIISEVDRVRALIDSMEGFTDTRPRAFVAENIHAVLSHVRQVASTGFGARLRFEERYDPSLPLVACDRDALVQMFLNLVKNAVEASPNNGVITLKTGFRQGFRVRQPGSEHRISLPIEVCVIDEGEGPPAHVVDHLFEPFVTARPGGTGLGLALAAKQATDHGGMIEFSRQEGRTIFRVLLPMAHTAA